MKSSSRRGKTRSSFSTYPNEHSAPNPHIKTTEIPITSPATAGDRDHAPPPPPPPTAAVVKIQAAYRSLAVRRLVKIISAVNSDAKYWERLIQRQETVDAVRSSERERIKVNEALMGLLLRLDSVPGFDPSVRELRRHLSRRIVGLQEILDSVSDARIQSWDGFLNDWDDVFTWMEKDVCETRGGGDAMERFCAEHLGFHCFQRFLRDE